MVGNMLKSWFYLLIGLALLGSQAVFDYAWTDWANTHGNTISAVSAVTGVLVTIYFINAFSDMRLAKQEEERFRALKKIAFRSLSQTVNDVGRRLIAPIAGVDLYKAGVPQSTAEDFDRRKQRLSDIGLKPLTVNSGFWGSISVDILSERIKVLAEDPTFVDEMFRESSKARRELQSALAEWAPVMVRVPKAYEDLEAGWPLADQIVRLAEAWRTVQICQTASEPFDISEVRQNYELTISSYRSWLEQLQMNAALPTRGSFIQERDWKS